MNHIDNTIFKDDLAVLKLIEIIENGKDDFILATEVEGCCVPVKISFTEMKIFKLDFQIKEDFLVKMGNDFFFTHHIMIFAKGLHLLVQNKNILEITQSFKTENDSIDISLTINSFRADIDDNLWKNSKQSAYCFFDNRDFYNNKFGVLFDMTTDSNQNSSWKNTLKLEIENSLFLLCFYADGNGRQFFVLKSQKNVSHNKFLKVLESVKVALGLISGFYIADYVWFFAGVPHDIKSMTFRFENIGRTINNHYPLLDSLPYHDLIEADRKLSSVQFENLVKLYYECQEIQRSSVLLIQAGNVNGISKGCLAAVALETIKSKIVKIEDEDRCLIKDKKIESELRSALTKAINSIKNYIDRNIYERLISKVGQINQVSNAENLKAPFEKLNIELTKDEIYCLKYRNSLLHGSTLKPEGELYSNLNSEELVEMVSNRLIMLTTMLLLKKCGYEGNIVDWGYTLISKKRAILQMKSIHRFGNSFRSLKWQSKK